MQDREIRWEAELKGVSPEEVVDFYYADTPLRRLQTPEDVASMALFLASDAAMSITGESVAINGGSYMD
jgi:meso-butanediol dehydrogenase/(S,S)-butanediol dehydrogenase/diacetyl reductase